MITVLHRGGYAQMITILHGGGSLGTPKSDYVICARPLKGHFFTGSLKLCLRVGVEINWFPLIGDRDKHSVYLTIKTTAMYCFKVSFFGQFSLAGLVG